MTLETGQEEIIVAAAPVSPPAIAIPRRPLRWSAIIGGVIVTAGIWLLLHALGLGIGLIALDPTRPASLRGVGIGTGIWSFIVPLLALFGGGLVTGYLAGAIPRISAMIHGAVLWSLATLLSLLLLVVIVGGLLGSAARIGGQVVGAAGSVAAQGIAELEDISLESLGLSESTLLAPVNERLRAAGKPAVTADELRAALRDAVRTSVRQGRLDRAVLVQSLAEQTPLTRAEAQQVALTLERQWEQSVGRARTLGSTAQVTALEAAESTGKGLLVLFFLMAVGLVAAIGGVLVPVSRENRPRENRPRGSIPPDTTPPGPPPPPETSTKAPASAPQ